ncbi:MAG: hypothetical protein IPL61_28250 [Myxococcales bacterium]|nr:hypothetical protein [Myxococcales bacterium]
MAVSLNFSWPPVDGWHRAVLDKIADRRETLLAAVSGSTADTFEGVVAAKASATRSVHFDIIGHSKDGVQALCDWLAQDDIIARDITTRWAQAFPIPQLGNVRFLGCNTAVTDAGIAALSALSIRWGVSIVGTTTPIDDGDFSDDGFAPLHAKTKTVSATDRAEVDDDQRRMSWFRSRKRARPMSADALSSLRTEALVDVAHGVQRYHPTLRWKIGSVRVKQIQRVLSASVDVRRVSPGLLALPDHEFVWPAPTSLGLLRFHRMTVLLGGAYVRLYPKGQPAGVLVCLSTRGDAYLAELAAAAPSPFL